MLERIAQLMANPNAQMQQGLDMIAGTTPQELLARAQIQGLQSETAEKNRKAEERAYISEILSQGELTPEVVRQVMRYDPEYGMELMDYMRKQDAQKGKQEFLSRYMGGGQASGGTPTEGRDPSALVTAGALYNDPVLMQLGNFEQTRIDNERKRADDLEKEKRKLTAETNEEKRKAGIEGFDLSEGAVPTTAIVTEATKKSTLIPRYERAKKNVMAVLEKHGDSELFTPAQAKEVRQALSDLRNLEREVGNTGVLNVGELPFLEENYAPFNPLEAGNRLVSKEELKANAEKFFENRKQLIKDEMGALGYKYKEESAAIPEGILPEEWNAMTDEERALWQ